jgi:hypothetical protein
MNIGNSDPSSRSMYEQINLASERSIQVNILYRDGLRKEYSVNAVHTEGVQYKLIEHQGSRIMLIPFSIVRELTIDLSDMQDPQ